ncbi:hypothetical protein JD844_001159 [Phrynosoma platyrhinos]|uniref:Vomeronasal type-2 receptor 26-like n=1 Tax=Phrynosoma platyrhinos TaxID=52577 RepID=A0ABQ7T958_PHRPL|nr:hypothetical protein JD844_001159 [Phrynosoma platyrhinos]
MFPLTMAVFLILVLVLLPVGVCKIPVAKYSISEPIPILHKYYQAGDLTIASIISQSLLISDDVTFRRHPNEELIDENMVFTQIYQHILALVFAVKEINENVQILPNITLGFDIYNNYFRPRLTFQSSMELLSSRGKFIPNYKCNIQNIPVAVIGGPNSNICLHMAAILGNYKMPQVGCVQETFELTYAPAPGINNQIQGLFFHWMFPNGHHQYTGILQLLLHFKWMWIGVIYLNVDSAETFIHDMLPIFIKSGICFDFIEKIHLSSDIAETIISGIMMYTVILKSSVNTVVFHGEIQSIAHWRILHHFFESEEMSMKKQGIVWIMTAEMDFTSLFFQKSWDTDFLHGALSFSVQSKDMPGFKRFVQSRKPFLHKEDGCIMDFWEQAFNCFFPTSMVQKTKNVCTEEEKIETLPGSVFETGMTSHSYSIYNAVYAVAYALHAMLLSILKPKIRMHTERWILLNHHSHQLHHFLRSISFNNSAGEVVSFDQNGELVGGFNIINWVTFSNQSFLRVTVGRIDPNAAPDKVFAISEDAIVWPSIFNQIQPLSLCNDNCHPGYRRTKEEGRPFCCYNCLPCPEGKISNQTGENGMYSLYQKCWQ